MIGWKWTLSFLDIVQGSRLDVENSNMLFQHIRLNHCKGYNKSSYFKKPANRVHDWMLKKIVVLFHWIRLTYPMYSLTGYTNILFKKMKMLCNRYWYHGLDEHIMEMCCTSPFKKKWKCFVNVTGIMVLMATLWGCWLVALFIEKRNVV